MANHDKERQLCWFWIEDSPNGCEAMTVQRCSNCTFFKTSEDFFSGRESAWVKIKQLPNFEALRKKYHNFDDEKRKIEREENEDGTIN